MATITIKNGTPVGTESLCLKCASAHYQRGYRESEMVVYCARIWDVLRVVPFAVRECNDYRDADMPDRDAMEKIALIINPSTHGSNRLDSSTVWKTRSRSLPRALRPPSSRLPASVDAGGRITRQAGSAEMQGGRRWPDSIY